MTYLLPEGVTVHSVLSITCKKGSVRANHYHKKDTHYCYLLSGKMEYVYKDANKEGKEKHIIVNSGEVVYSPPMVTHAMRFLEDSVFFAFTTEQRDSEKYEKDTVRVNLIDQ